MSCVKDIMSAWPKILSHFRANVIYYSYIITPSRKNRCPFTFDNYFLSYNYTLPLRMSSIFMRPSLSGNMPL